MCVAMCPRLMGSMQGGGVDGWMDGERESA